MNRTRSATLLVAGLLLGSACTGSDGGGTISTEQIVTTESVATSQTTAPSSTTETTLSEIEIEAAAIAEAEAEIEAAVVGWYTYPYDTALGDEGMALEFLTGALRERQSEVAATYSEAGQVLKSGGDQQVEVRNIRVDLDGGVATIDACSKADGVVIDTETGDQLGGDDGDVWMNQIQARLVGDRWLLEFFTSGEGSGGDQCVLSN